MYEEKNYLKQEFKDRSHIKLYSIIKIINKQEYKSS